MRERGFLEEDHKTARDLIENHMDHPLVTLGVEELVSHAVSKMRAHKISQIPVTKDGEFVGMVDERTLINQIMDNAEMKDEVIGKIMGPKLPVVTAETSIQDLS